MKMEYKEEGVKKRRFSLEKMEYKEEGVKKRRFSLDKDGI